MCKVYYQGDYYKVEAARMFGVPYDEVTPEQRKRAKAEMWRQMYSKNCVGRTIPKYHPPELTGC